ncbi:MAG: enoyl-CoA hydratase-related protein [Pseudomonadota bacterium]
MSDPDAARQEPAPTDEAVVLRERPADHVMLIKINRPQQRNALNYDVRKGIADALTAAAEDDDVRAVVLTGDDKAFAAGADIREMRERGPMDMRRLATDKLWDRIAGFTKPFIAAVNGYALGGGCELAMHCDIIIAGENATFGQPEVKIGIMPGGSGTQRLFRAVGKYKGMEMVLTGDLYTAAQCERMGLVSRIVPDGEVVNEAISMAGRIARNAPVAVQLTKEAALAGADASLATGVNLERKMLWLLFDSEDKREGMDAFLEKRKPAFKGR